MNDTMKEAVISGMSGGDLKREAVKGGDEHPSNERDQKSPGRNDHHRGNRAGDRLRRRLRISLFLDFVRVKLSRMEYQAVWH